MWHYQNFHTKKEVRVMSVLLTRQKRAVFVCYSFFNIEGSTVDPLNQEFVMGHLDLQHIISKPPAWIWVSQISTVHCFASLRYETCTNSVSLMCHIQDKDRSYKSCCRHHAYKDKLTCCLRTLTHGQKVWGSCAQGAGGGWVDLNERYQSIKREIT